MKTKIGACILALNLLGVAHAADDDRALQKICDYIKVDDRTNLRRTLEDNTVDLRREYSDIKCGKYSLLRYAAISGGVETATLIVSKAGKKSITDKEGDGANTLEWAQKQVDSADAATKPKIKAVIELMQSKM